jgi:high-affinity iron transporter
MDVSAAFPAFMIALREGVEAALVVGIVLALLQKSQQTQLKPWVYFGVFSGLLASALVGILLTSLLHLLQNGQPYTEVLLPLLKLSFSLIAIAMLTWMLIWMTQQARTAKAEIEGALISALDRPNQAQWGVWTLVFVAVLREGIETVLFILAQAQQGWMPVAGAITGLIGATGIGWGLFALGIRINLKRFFQVMGVFLLLIVGGLVVGACKQFDLLLTVLSTHFAWASAFCAASSAVEPAASCVLGPLLWDGHLILPERQFPGIVLKTLLGYRERLFWGQAIAYGIFLSVAGTLYWRSLNQPNLVSPQAPKSASSSVRPPALTKESP